MNNQAVLGKDLTAKYARSNAPSVWREGGYQCENLYNGDSCVVLVSTVEPQATGITRHVHEFSDQVYYVLDGTMQIQLGDEHFTASKDSLVYIPQSTPHHNWNDGDCDEVHFEVLAPSPLITQDVLRPVNSTDVGEVPGFVRPLDEVEITESRPGYRTARMLDLSDGSRAMSLFVAEVAGLTGGVSHIHPFDEFHFVLEGELTMTIALDTFVARPGTLVIVPAGMPHTERNESNTRERHLVLSVPEPHEGLSDVGVDITPT